MYIDILNHSLEELLWLILCSARDKNHDQLRLFDGTV